MGHGPAQPQGHHRPPMIDAPNPFRTPSARRSPAAGPAHRSGLDGDTATAVRCDTRRTAYARSSGPRRDAPRSKQSTRRTTVSKWTSRSIALRQAVSWLVIYRLQGPKPSSAIALAEKDTSGRAACGGDSLAPLLALRGWGRWPIGIADLQVSVADVGTQGRLTGSFMPEAGLGAR